MSIIEAQKEKEVEATSNRTKFTCFRKKYWWSVVAAVAVVAYCVKTQPFTSTHKDDFVYIDGTDVVRQLSAPPPVTQIRGIAFTIPAMGTKSIPRENRGQCNVDDIPDELMSSIKRTRGAEVTYVSSLKEDVHATIWFFSGRGTCQDVHTNLAAQNAFVH